MSSDYAITVKAPYPPVAEVLRSSDLIEIRAHEPEWMSMVVGGSALATAGWDDPAQETLVVVTDPAHEGLPRQVYELLISRLPHEITLHDSDDDVVLAHRDRLAVAR